MSWMGFCDTTMLESKLFKYKTINNANIQITPFNSLLINLNTTIYFFYYNIINVDVLHIHKINCSF